MAFTRDLEQGFTDGFQCVRKIATSRSWRVAFFIQHTDGQGKMLQHRQFKDKITVRFYPREDGGLQARCDGLDGFLLSNQDPQAVLRDVVPAIEMIVRTNLGIEVTASPLRNGIYLVEESAATSDELIPEARDYLIEKSAAA